MLSKPCHDKTGRAINERQDIADGIESADSVYSVSLRLQALRDIVNVTSSC